MQTAREGTLLNRACFAGGRCVAAGKLGGERTVFVTADGLTWTQTKLDGRPYVTRIEVLYAEQNHFHLVVNEDGEKPGVMRSADGIKWEPRKPVLDNPKVLRHDAHLRRGVLGANGQLVVIGDYGARLSRKAVGDQWQAVPNAAARDTLIDLAFGNGVFVGGGLHGLRMRSRDGLDWTDRVTGEEGEHINAMIWDGRQFVGVGQGGTYLSQDGKAWRREANESAPTAATFAEGIFIGTLWPGKILRSTDGIRWKQVHQFPHHILALAHGQLG